jgi:hypothetical protein
LRTHIVVTSFITAPKTKLNNDRFFAFITENLVQIRSVSLNVNLGKCGVMGQWMTRSALGTLCADVIITGLVAVVITNTQWNGSKAFVTLSDRNSVGMVKY